MSIVIPDLTHDQNCVQAFDQTLKRYMGKIW